ncbi:hypothetical protein M2375_001729 [Comamonas sp. BIGb0152]|nr:hypothetical protein [Comamonas sp. BIGb0152]
MPETGCRPHIAQGPPKPIAGFCGQASRIVNNFHLFIYTAIYNGSR